MKSLKNCYINFRGSGNLDADLWIFGFEPGGNVLDNNQEKYRLIIINDDEKELLRHSQNYSNEFVEKSKVYQQIFNLLNFFHKYSSYYYNNNRKVLIFSKQSNIFYSNLYLLKWPSENPDQNNFDQKKQFQEILNFYKEHFLDLKSQTWERRKIYRDDSIDWVLERGKKYFNTSLKNSSAVKIIFILKKGYEEEYLKLLNPEYSVNDIKELKTGLLHRNKQIYIKYLFKDHLIIFLANGLSDKIKLISILKKLSLEDQKIKNILNERLMSNL